MNQTQSNNFSVNSQFFIQQLDVLIIKITRALAVEYGIMPDPDAKEMIRKILLERAHSLMSDKSTAFVKDYVQTIHDLVKTAHPQNKTWNRSSYELIKLMGLEHV